MTQPCAPQYWWSVRIRSWKLRLSSAPVCMAWALAHAKDAGKWTLSLGTLHDRPQRTSERMSMFKTLWRRLAGALVAAASLAFLPQAAEAKGAPALWSVSDADTTVYLFGTIHLLPDNYTWRTAKIDHAVAGSNELVLETIVDDKDPMKLAGVLARLGFSNGLAPI